MKKLIASILVLFISVAFLSGCNSNKTEKGEPLEITFNTNEGEAPKQTEPLEPLNTAVQKQDVEFKGDRYGVIINNAKEEDIKAKKIEKFTYKNGSEAIAVMPYYPGSKIRVESVVYDMAKNYITPVETLFETTSTKDYALILYADRPDGVMPEIRVTVEYEGTVYSNLIKNVPDSETEYIR
ncbi:MAG: hypothetical protein PHE51_03040 [Eubacteriales bacterium]|nr:hypothetical protein [Eubacteriales bacterium]